MKKTALLVFTIVIFCQSAISQTFSVVTPSNHTVYFQFDNGGVEATYCTYSMPNYGSTLAGTLIIPDSVEYNNTRYPVTAIGYNAFHHAYGIDTVVLPNTITTIKQEAFCACSDLVSVVIPNSVTTLGNLAFAACHNLSDLKIGESVTTIGNQAFDADTSLVSVTIPNSVVTIGQSAFSQNYSLRSIRLGSSLISIGFACFTYCHNLDSLFFVTETAPYYSGEFWGTPDTLTIDIPCGSYHSYSAFYGTHHNYIIPTVDLSMTVLSSDSSWGTATILQDADSHDVRCDSSVVVKAVANYGYHFVQWNNGSTRATDTLYLYTDSTIMAIFAKNQYTVDVLSVNPTLGTVEGGGTFEYLDTIDISAHPIAHHHLVSWSDGNRDTTRNYIVTQNAVLQASFAIDTHHVEISSEDESRGSVHGSDGFVYGNGNFAYGTLITVLATPNTGYHFTCWNDSVTDNPRYIVIVQDTILIAHFGEGNVGIASSEGETTIIYSDGGRIIIKGAEGKTVSVYDAVGRMMLASKLPELFVSPIIPEGVYIAKIDGEVSKVLYIKQQ